MSSIIQGPCDTSGCPNEAVVHYGLEEFYCQSCDDESYINMLKAALAAYPWLSSRIQQRRVAQAARRLHDSRPALRYSQASC